MKYNKTCSNTIKCSNTIAFVCMCVCVCVCECCFIYGDSFRLSCTSSKWLNVWSNYVDRMLALSLDFLKPGTDLEMGKLVSCLGSPQPGGGFTYFTLFSDRVTDFDKLSIIARLYGPSLIIQCRTTCSCPYPERIIVRYCSYSFDNMILKHMLFILYTLSHKSVPLCFRL